MDLSRKEFDVAGAVEEGATLHLVGPFDGQPLYDTKTAKGKEVNIPIPLTLNLGHKTPKKEVLVY